MKFYKVLISILILYSIVSCDNSSQNDKPKQETPKALQDKGSSYEYLSKSRSEDLLENLYKELVEKTPELKRLEERIAFLNSTKEDSTETFDEYHSKNQSYFGSANAHLGEIKDSVLRTKMNELIASSLSKYNSSISHYSDLLAHIESGNLTLNDLHTAVKITWTLPVIEKYQKDNLPSAKPIEGFAKHLDETIRYADSLAKK